MRIESTLTKPMIVRLLSTTEGDAQLALFKRAYAVKVETLGKNVHLRGLIEFSNQCRKNCLYCGIRSGNASAHRYTMTDEEILAAVSLAKSKDLTGVVLQSGERNDADFVNRITALIRQIKKATDVTFRITLSVGEQSEEVYKRWFDAGAQRYLLRMETTDKKLYHTIHPNDGLHSFETRLRCLENIQKAGFQTGTGVMIGLPGQTMESLADDLLFIQQMGIDMVGMGPYLEHAQTPMFEFKESRLPLIERFELSLRMIAALRLLMPTINIASTTALQSIIPTGREFGLKAGANVLMPNLTPVDYRKHYVLYKNKPHVNMDAAENLDNLVQRIRLMGERVVFKDFGDSRQYINRQITFKTQEQ